jgi:hypothetical protein
MVEGVATSGVLVSADIAITVGGRYNSFYFWLRNWSINCFRISQFMTLPAYRKGLTFRMKDRRGRLSSRDSL